MEYKEIEEEVISLANYIDEEIDMLEKESIAAQAAIFAMLMNEIFRFEIKDARFVIGQDFRGVLMGIQKKANEIISGKSFTNAVSNFISSFDNIQNKTVKLMNDANGLQLPKTSLNPVVESIKSQTKESLGRSINSEVIQPLKKVIAQSVMQGQTISKTNTQLSNWDKGTLGSGRLSKGVKAPSLDKYVSDIAIDSAYSVQRNTNNVFAEEFSLTKFIYAGTLVKDSRPLCRHLVNQNRIFDLDEMPPLIALYPQGLFPNTTRDNFSINAGGFKCKHCVLMVG